MSTDRIELGPIGAPERQVLRNQLADYRLARLPERLARVAALVDSVPEYQLLRPAVATLLHWYSEVEAGGPMPDWSLLYVLQRVAFPSRDVAARRAAISNLAAWTLLCALRERRCPVGALPTRSDDSGRVLDLRGACFIELDPRPGAVIQWAVRGDRAVARSEQREPSTSVSLAELDATRRPALRSAFGIPVFGEPWPLGSDDDGGPPSPSQLPLLRSVDEAHRILSACMPQALAWIEQLVPAFVSLGHPRSPGANRSETHEAGGPLFLGLVDEPMRHAEALVHETQHQRYRLFEISRPFRSATDRERRYASPWRTDLRPMRGIQLGLHAFVAVNELRLRVLDRGLARDDIRLTRNALQSHYANLFAFRTIHDHDPPTAEGRRYVHAMARLLRSQHMQIARFLRPGDDHHIHAYFERHCGGEDLAAAVNAGPEHRDWAGTLKLIEGLSA